MNIPLMYIAEAQVGELVALDEATARHAVQVLRMVAGSPLELTNGEGMLWRGTIASVGKKSCQVLITGGQKLPPALPCKVALGIAPVKNASRLEWFIEKATELGVDTVYLLSTQRTEKQHLRYERLVGITQSAMLQSRQVWQPRIVPPQPLYKVLEATRDYVQWIAHCGTAPRQPLSALLPAHRQSHKLLLVGPEGDFTDEEIALAESEGCRGVSLGRTRLRTETAGVAAASMLCLCQ
jgi:16S rRNA (uracil1498-N3)-methyltransferase